MEMKILKKIIGIIILMLSLQIMYCNIWADDSAATGDNAAGNGSSGNSGPAQVQPTFEPKIMVESYQFSKKVINAGDKVIVQITLVNTSRNVAVKNMMVTAAIENEYMQLLSETDSIYIPQIYAGGRYIVSYQFKTKINTPPGQYELALTMDYADKDGNTYNEDGKVKVNVNQKAKIKFDDLIIASEAEVGDTIEAQVNAMNLGRGKICNVRAKIKADGLVTKGTIYIGDIEAGARGSGNTQVIVGSMKKGEPYGVTNGVVTYYYESESGKKAKLKKKFSLEIQKLSVEQKEQEDDKEGQWWIVMSVIGGILCIFVGIGISGIIRKNEERYGKIEEISKTQETE